MYNLAGENVKRINYLPTVIAGKVIGNPNASMGEVITNATLQGQGLKYRRFGTWCRETGYAAWTGISSTQLNTGGAVDPALILPHIDHPVGSDVFISDARIGAADFTFWVNSWLLANHPESFNKEYGVTFNEQTFEATILFKDGTSYTFPLSDYDMTGTYLYVTYTVVGKNTVEPIIPGTLVQVAGPADYPSTVGWQSNGATSGPKTVNLNTHQLIQVTYSDNRPPETSTRDVPYTQQITETDAEYEKTEYIGGNPSGSEINSLRSIMHQLHTNVIDETQEVRSQDETLPGGVVKTTKTTTTYQAIRMVYGYRIDTQIITNRKYSNLQYLIYKKGSGNAALDAIFTTGKVDEGVIPPIAFKTRDIVNGRVPLDIWGYLPLRQGAWEQWMPPEDTRLTVQSSAAFKKAFDKDYREQVTKMYNDTRISGSPWPVTIFTVFGVPFNSPDKASKKYIYRFFQSIIQQGGTGGNQQQWQLAWNQADISQRNWLLWRDAQADPMNPLYGKPEPARLPYPVVPNNSMDIRAPNIQYSVSVNWSALSEATGTGKGFPGARLNDVKFEIGSTTNYEELIISGGLTSWRPGSSSLITMTWQYEENKWRSIGVWNLQHVNTISPGNLIITTGIEALNTAAESKFLVPAHIGVLRSLPIRDANQMAQSFSYMVMNYAYEIQKENGWGIFKIVTIIQIIVFSIITAGAGSGASVGLLGSAAGVGAALGFTGTIAIIVGSIANAVAAMLLSQLIMAGSTALFGEQIGAIIGTILSIMAVSYGTAYSNGTSTASFNVSDVFTAENMMKLSVAAGQGYAGVINKDTAEYIQQTQELLEQYNTESLAISEAWKQNLGGGLVNLDPSFLVDVARPNPFAMESSNTFLSRTLTVGSDIADMTNGIVTNFAAMTINTQLPS
jgi:hypothetical protein